MLSLSREYEVKREIIQISRLTNNELIKKNKLFPKY